MIPCNVRFSWYVSFLTIALAHSGFQIPSNVDLPPEPLADSFCHYIDSLAPVVMATKSSMFDET